MCTLTPEAIAAGRNGLLPGLSERVQEAEALENGYRLTFAASSETLLAIARVIDAERQCCRWLQFDLQVPPGQAPLVLMLTGPPGTRAFLDALLDADALQRGR
jgi:hypothetical protein